MARIGLVAGGGKLPALFADCAKAKGETVIAFGAKGMTDETLAAHVDRFHWIEWGALHKGALLLAMERIRKIVLLGKVPKDIFFQGDKVYDDKARAILSKADDLQDYSILQKITKFLGTFGVEVVDPIPYLSDLIPQKGMLTKRSPTAEESDDIEYGATVAREMARFDIGQTICVRRKTVVAIEAIEGTDKAIARAGELAADGFVVVKMARPHQDMRFDIPLVGLETLETLIKSGGRVFALESGKTFLMDRDAVIKRADEAGVSIVII